MSVYFDEKEFTRCQPPCKLEDMDERFLAKLDLARAKAGIPFVLNCAYRSRAWDLSKGRTGNSAHCSGKAVDIRCNTSANRMKIMQGLLAAGFTRIGIGRTFVHADSDETKPQGVIWHYYDSNG